MYASTCDSRGFIPRIKSWPSLANRNDQPMAWTCSCTHNSSGSQTNTSPTMKGLMASFRFRRLASMVSPTYFLPSIHLSFSMNSNYTIRNIDMDYILKANIIFQVSSDLSKFTIPPNPATSHLEVQTNNERSEGWNEE
jgi:hypothetical protein